MGIFHRRKKKQSGKILVQNGMNIGKTYIGSRKGDYFGGSRDLCDTYLAGDKNYRIWIISFVNLENGTLYRKKFRNTLWIGRTEIKDADKVCLCLAGDMRISKIHCVIYEWNDCLYLNDYQSKNHTYLNGNCISEPVRLHNGDVIKAGGTRLKVEFGKG